MDTLERERQREQIYLSTATAGNQQMYDYSNRSAQELQRMLAERDRQIGMLERQIQEYGIQIPNYPSCYPLIRVDIEGDVPAQRQGFCKGVLTLYYFQCIVLIANMICFFIASQAENRNKDVNQDQWDSGQWLSIAFLLGIPVSFPMWFWTTYSALKTGQNRRYGYSLIGIGIGFLGAVFALVGMVPFGTCGAFSSFRAKDDKGDTAFYCVMGTMVGWCVCVACLLYVFVRQVRYMRQDRKISKLTEQAAHMMIKAAAS